MKHGKNWVYLKGCRCDPCRDAHRIYERDRQRSIRREQYGLETRNIFFVDATEVREHLNFLRSKKIGLKTISERTNVSKATLQSLRNGKRKFVTLPVQEKVLAVSSLPSKGGHYVDAAEAKRLVDELLRQGFTMRQIAKATGRKQIVLKTFVRLSMLEEIRQLHKAWMPVKG